MLKRLSNIFASPLEQRWSRIRREGRCYVLLFGRGVPIASGDEVSGLCSTTREAGIIGEITHVRHTRTGKHTDQFYFAHGVLGCVVAYDGHVPSWLEREKLGIVPQPVQNWRRLLPHPSASSILTRGEIAAPEIWDELCSQFQLLWSHVENKRA